MVDKSKERALDPLNMSEPKERPATYKGHESELPKRAKSVWMPGEKESKIREELKRLKSYEAPRDD